ncbi:MAG: 1,4-dihydroxy-2-naphthoate octaprenyltransferase [Bacteroidales bacterium]|nr:1,4-dihydroxy-2-naphthoate octaprenyltransferase [Bacteroidales bacterium]
MASRPSIQPENKSGQSPSAGRRSPGGKLLLWFKIVRPQTLFASACPVLVGWKLSSALTGQTNAAVAWLTLCCALALQILSNLINDYYDFRRGADNKGRQGFKRALAEGTVSEGQIRRACLAALTVAVLTGAVLVWTGGWPILIIGLTALLFAWLYTATDYSLSYLGIADVFVLLYYGLLACWGTVWLQQASAWPWTETWLQLNLSLPDSLGEKALLAGGVNGLISMCVLAINNLRDIQDDRAVNKKTFPVRFGKKAALAGLGIIVLLMPLAAWLSLGPSLALLVVVPALFLYYKVLTSSGAQYNGCLLMAGLTNAVYTALVWISL